jgi:hypothetical protein
MQHAQSRNIDEYKLPVIDVQSKANFIKTRKYDQLGPEFFTEGQPSGTTDTEDGGPKRTKTGQDKHLAHLKQKEEVTEATGRTVGRGHSYR